MVVFNDPLPCEDAALRAIRMAVAMRTPDPATLAERGSVAAMTSASVGVAQGYATMGRIGFEGRYDYTAIGSVMNLASRLCAVATHGRSSSPSECTARRRTIVVQ